MLLLGYGFSFCPSAETEAPAINPNAVSEKSTDRILISCLLIVTPNSHSDSRFCPILWDIVLYYCMMLLDICQTKK